MAVRQIPNLTPAVFISPSAQLEIVQDGSTFRVSAQQIADLGGGIVVSNDTASSIAAYPLFSKITEGMATVLWSSDPNYKYVPSEGRLSARRVEALQGIVFNSSTITLDYTFPTGDNATSCGPLTVTAAITVPTGSEWMIL